MTKLRNIKLLERYKPWTKPTTRSVIDRIISLYKQNKINIAAAEKLSYQTIGRENAPQTALKRIESYESKDSKPKQELTRTYFVSGRVQIKKHISPERAKQLILLSSTNKAILMDPEKIQQLM